MQQAMPGIDMRTSPYNGFQDFKLEAIPSVQKMRPGLPGDEGKWFSEFRRQRFMKKIIKPNLFTFLDYRRYLADFYRRNKEENPAFSYRFLAQRMQTKSPQYLKMVIDGERNLTEAYAKALGNFLGFSEEESKYLRLLMNFEKAETLEDKDRLVAEMRSLSPALAVHRIKGEHLNILEEWEFLPLLELMTHPSFDDDMDQLVQKMGLKHGQIEKAIKRLKDAGYLVLDSKGRWQKKFHAQDTQDEVANYYVQRYHVLNLRAAAQRVFQQKVDEREYSSLTFRADQKTVAELKKKMKAFRAELIEFLSGPREEGDHVYQLNLQLFRVTTKS